MKYFIVLVILTCHSLMALTSIEPIEIGHTKGVYGNTLLSLETKKGNTDKENYKASVFLAYDNNRSYVNWMKIAAEYGEVNNIEDTNKVYLHLRHIHTLTPKNIRYEYFGQVEEDQFKLIKHRRLIGAGLRFRVFEIFKDGNGYLGLGAFAEYIRYTSNLDPNETNARFNSYFAYTMPLENSSRLTYTFFYQPKVNEFKDNVQSHKLVLQLLVYKKLFLNFNISYDRDSEPAIGVQKYDLTQTTSLLWKF